MNRKLGQLMKAALFALPLALPGVALAQSAGGSAGSTTDTAQPNAQDTSKGSLDQEKNMNAPAPTPKSDEGTYDRNPPAGSLDTSGATKETDQNIGGDINKPSDTSTTTKKKTTKKSTKKSTMPSTTTPDTSTGSDVNR